MEVSLHNKDCLKRLAHSLPKAELHLHIEGSLEPDMLLRLGERNGINLPFRSIDEVYAAYQFSRLQDFLDIYYQGMRVLLTAEDFYDLTLAYLERAAQDNVVHAEIFFDPQAHTERGVSFAAVTDGILAALEEGAQRFGVSSKLIMCFLRHLDERDAFKILQTAQPWLDRILAVGLDSSESGHPPSKFERVFEKARTHGLKCVAHAGEEGPPDYVREALDVLMIDRLDHGNRAMEDADLVKQLARSGMTLTVCPLSNLKLCVVDAMDNHPLKAMLDTGLRATVNSDDPAYFGGYVNDNFDAVIEALPLTEGDIRQLATNSIAGSFLDSETKALQIKRIENEPVIASFPNGTSPD